jgi:hypothetical protein
VPDGVTDTVTVAESVTGGLYYDLGESPRASTESELGRMGKRATVPRPAVRPGCRLMLQIIITVSLSHQAHCDSAAIQARNFELCHVAACHRKAAAPRAGMRHGV